MSPFLVFALYGAVTVGLAWLLAGHMHRVFTGRQLCRRAAPPLP